MKAWKAELYLLLVTFIWGGTFVFTKIGLNDCPFSLYIIIRFTVALILSLALFGRNILKADKKTIKHGIILGLLFGGGFLLQTYGLTLTSVSKSAFITGITVVLTPFAYWLTERKKILFWQKVGVLVASVGLWLFTKPDFHNINWGDAATLLSTLFWAFYITYIDVFTRGRKDFAGTSQLVMLQFMAAAPLALVYFLVFDLKNYTFHWTGSLLLSLSYNAVLASFLVTFIHTSIQRYTTPVKAALIFSLEPVVASVVAVIFLNEILNNVEYLGASLLFAGVIFSETGEFLLNLIKKKLSKIYSLVTIRE